MSDQNNFDHACADYRCAISRFLRGSIESDELIEILRGHADKWPALHAPTARWMEVDRLVGLDNLNLKIEWQGMAYHRMRRNDTL